VPYLSGLGISHLYLSPCFQARRGSTHGYDIVDPNRISEELGGEADAWAAHLRRWFQLNAHSGAPDAVEEYFIYQTLAGAWPIEPDRVEAYIEKALREAKRSTSWISPNEGHERRVKRFCRHLYRDQPFGDDFEAFLARLAAAGERAAHAQVALKLSVPGVPDIYQGDELGFRALVDPDNRRAVDWERQTAALANPPPKLRLVRRLLQFRARAPEVFERGYEPLDAGPSVCAFMRGGRLLVVVALRPHVGDASISVPAGTYRDVLAGRERTLSGDTRVADLHADAGIAGVAVLDGGVG
jgi:(1->4)-alpha-D-glucan 1-alpha-D-glucosylmutase